jgi:hypothetical protein
MFGYFINFKLRSSLMVALKTKNHPKCDGIVAMLCAHFACSTCVLAQWGASKRCAYGFYASVAIGFPRDASGAHCRLGKSTGTLFAFSLREVLSCFFGAAP